MYSPYGSYSGMSAPMDIGAGPQGTRTQDASCAFPSWPRRSSLSDSEDEKRPSSYLSDADLYLSDPFEDDARSVSSAGSSSSSQPSPPPQITDAELLEMERERLAYQREVVRFLVSEKERRRQALKKQRRSSSTSSSGSGSSKKSPKSAKLSAMTPIAEAE